MSQSINKTMVKSKTYCATTALFIIALATVYKVGVTCMAGTRINSAVVAHYVTHIIYSCASHGNNSTIVQESTQKTTALGWA